MTDNHFERMEDAVLEAFGEPPKPSVRATHLDAIRQQMPEMLPFPSRRRRMFIRAGAAAFGFVLAGGTAMAATGTLPDPVQTAVADAVDAVVDIPGGSAAGGNPKNPIAAANKAEAEAFTEAKKAYNACKKEERVAAASASPASASPASASPEGGEATPAPSACGEKPVRADFQTDSPKPESTERPEKTRNPNAADKTPNPNAGNADGEPGGGNANSDGGNATGGGGSNRPEKTERPARTPKPVPPSQAD